MVSGRSRMAVAGAHLLVGLTGFREAALVCVDDDLHAITQPQLHQDPCDVGLDGWFTDKRLRSYLGVGKPAGDQAHDLGLTWRQLLELARRGCDNLWRASHELLD